MRSLEIHESLESSGIVFYECTISKHNKYLKPWTGHTVKRVASTLDSMANRVLLTSLLT